MYVSIVQLIEPLLFIESMQTLKKLSFDVIGIYDASNQSYRLFIKKQSYTTPHILYFVTQIQVVFSVLGNQLTS